MSGARKISVGSDHAGFLLKTAVVAHLRGLGHVVNDVGPATADRMDYPETAHVVAEAVAKGTAELGILVCGSGVGMAIAANRHPNVRAANCTFESQAALTRQHNDANVLCLGERVVGQGLALSIVDTFLASTFEGGRHADRVKKIESAAATSVHHEDSASSP